MTPRRSQLLVLVVCLIAVLGACGAPAPSSSRSGMTTPRAATNAPGTSTAAADWHDATLPVEARVEALLAPMTADEKIGQMMQLEKGSATPADVTHFMLGSVLSGGDGAPAPNDPAGWYAMVDAYQKAALVTRLGIPMLYGVDAIHGVNGVVGATIFPHQVGLGAAHDPGLVARIGHATANEMAAVGIRWDFGPVVAVPQDVRWGRTYEGYGEDPALVGSLASSFIRGLQGTAPASAGSALATAKHFAGDGGTAWGSSTTNGYSIDQGVTDVPGATFRAIHLAPYKDAIDAGARIVMTSFSSTGAGKVTGDRHLITDVLKGELGFTGFVVSDWGAIDQVDPDYTTAVAKAISAGVDMAMVPSDATRFGDAIRAGLASGAITPARVDDAVRRILRVKFEMGLFEHPMPPSGQAATVGSAADRELAREAVSKSAVLLKASPGALPIDGSKDTVLLAGRGADDIGLQSGGWTITWQGSEGAVTPGTSIAAALSGRLGNRLRVDTSGQFPAGTKASTGIVVVAEPPYAEGRGDSATLALPADELAVIGRVRPLVDRLIVVVLSGRPMMLDAILPSADAVVAAWLPGTEGAGVADVLLGTTPFTGTTPYTWPLTPADAPRTGKKPCEGARYPAGYGLDVTGAPLGPAACPIP
jgi:beta-glucosidase